jgi:hypothetical protein
MMPTRRQKLDDSVKLLLVIMSILYSTAFALQLKTASSPPNGLFVFPLTAVIAYALGNLASGNRETLLKTFSVYFLTFSLGYFVLVIISTPSAPLIGFAEYVFYVIGLMLLSLFTSIGSVTYTDGNLNFFRSLEGFILLFAEIAITILVVSVMVAIFAIVALT